MVRAEDNMRPTRANVHDFAAAALCALAVAVATPALATPDGPPYYDPQRGIQRQQEAAADARQEVAGGNVEKAFEHLASVSAYVRDAVFEEIGGDWSNEQLVRLAPGLRSPDPFVAGQVAEILGTRPCAEAREALEGALGKQRHEEVLAEICWALGQIASAESIKPLEKALGRHGRKSFRVGADATLALAACARQDGMRYLREGLSHKLAGVRMVSLAHMLELEPAEALGAALAQLGEKQQKGWELRVLVQVCEVFRGPETREPHTGIYTKVMEALVPRLAEEEGRAKHEIGRTLRSLTGQWDLTDDAATWKGWWNANRDTFKPIARDRKAERAAEAGQSGETVTRYFGIPIYSLRMVFMLDLSGGMDRPIRGKGTDSPQRLRVAKDELIATLKDLNEKTKLNIVFFASQYFWCSPGLLPVKRAFQKLAGFIEQQEIPSKVHQNRGNIYDPLVEAMELPEVDTIYLLSEGNPTEGRFIDRGRFVRHMLRVQRFTKTEVNAFFIGSAKSAISYMKAIAEPTNGQFYDIAELKGW
jgi:hypothetical protein